MVQYPVVPAWDCLVILSLALQAQIRIPVLLLDFPFRALAWFTIRLLA
jgi:hypothetical protein